MRLALRKWIGDADARQSEESFGLDESETYAYTAARRVDLYYSLVGELFDYLRSEPEDRRDWASLGDALVSLGGHFVGEARSDALFFAACAFYSGGYSASAHIVMRDADPGEWADDKYRACYDLLARPQQIASSEVRRLVGALRSGEAAAVVQAVTGAEAEAALRR